MTSDVEYITSVQIQFMYVIGFSEYRNRGLMATEERVLNSSLGSYMVTSPPQDKCIPRSMNTYLLYLDHNTKLNIIISTLI